MVEYQFIPAIDSQLFIDILINTWQSHIDRYLADTQLTLVQCLDQHSIDSWLKVAGASTEICIDEHSMAYLQIIYSWLLTERSIKCTQPKCWSRVLIDTQLQMPLVHEKNYCFTFKIGNMEKEKRESIDIHLLCVNLEAYYFPRSVRVHNQLQVIQRFRHILSDWTNIKARLYNAFIMPHFQYCSRV